MGESLDKKGIGRRKFMLSATSAAACCVLSCDTMAELGDEPKITKALDDPNVIHKLVTFQSGSDEIDGYLARPRTLGRYPIVLVITGSSISEEYIKNTTAMLAQKRLRRNCAEHLFLAEELDHFRGKPQSVCRANHRHQNIPGFASVHGLFGATTVCGDQANWRDGILFRRTLRLDVCGALR